MMTKEACAVFSCGITAKAVGLCQRHYGAYRRNGDPNLSRKRGRINTLVCKVCGKPRTFRSRQALCPHHLKVYVRMKNKEYRAENRDKCIEYGRKYLADHREENKLRCRENYLRTRDLRLEYQHKYEHRKRIEKLKSKGRAHGGTDGH